MNKNIFIGGAWPYANGSLHVGHIAALLPGDILARYHRLRGDKVLYVSGTDCHGTPIAVKARQNGVAPETIAMFYHDEFTDNFRRLGFTYDYYGPTHEPAHMEFAGKFVQDLHDKGWIVSRTEDQVYCADCRQFLPDRFIAGRCPACGQPARGDQCEACGLLLDPSQLLERRCGFCGAVPGIQPATHLYFLLSLLQEPIARYLADSHGWRENAIALTKRYLSEGLRDRAVTRDLAWGIPVPIAGFEDKRIYVWIEAVLGYLSGSRAACHRDGLDWDDFFSDDSLHYYIHGKDNIPFHTVILPALLIAAGGLHLPDRIISSEFLTLEGRKISTSAGWAVWVPYLLERFDPDSIRYFMTMNAPERRDSDFTFREFVNSHNGELLGAYGNLVHRTLVFVQRFFDGTVPLFTPDEILSKTVEDLYANTGVLIEGARFREALEGIFEFIRSMNRYYDDRKPWIEREADPASCEQTIGNCVSVLADLSRLLSPFLPFSSSRVAEWLGLSHTATSAEPDEWRPMGYVGGGALAGEPEVLFTRLEKKVAEDEAARLRL